MFRHPGDTEEEANSYDDDSYEARRVGQSCQYKTSSGWLGTRPVGICRSVEDTCVAEGSAKGRRKLSHKLNMFLVSARGGGSPGCGINDAGVGRETVSEAPEWVRWRQR